MSQVLIRIYFIVWPEPERFQPGNKCNEQQSIVEDHSAVVEGEALFVSVCLTASEFACCCRGSRTEE